MLSSHIIPGSLEDGYSLEKEGKIEQAKAIYWEKINEKFIGDYPYNRLRIIYTKEKNWEQAISVCKRYINLSNDPVKKKQFGDWLRKYKANVNKETEILTTKYFADKYLLTSRKESTSSTIVCPHFKYPAYYKDILKKIIFVYKRYVPNFLNYSPSLDDISPSQKAFFQKWLSNWKQGKAFHLQGNHGYLLLYIKKLLSKENPQSGLSAIIEQLHLIRDIYSQESFNRFDSLIFYITFWIYQCYLIADLKTVATSWLRTNLLLVDNTNSPSRLGVIERYLSIKYHLNLKIEGIDLYCLSRSNRKYRNILQENKDEVINFLDKKINEFEAQYNIDLLKIMSEKFGTLISSTMLCLYEFNPQFKLNIPFYSYSELGELKIFFEQWLRDVENAIRDKLKLPKIGEGWVRETQLYNIISEYFGKQGYEVVHNAYPPFLEGLELDIFIPQLKLAIEHQGEQHIKSIDFFGGKRAYEALKLHDKRKHPRWPLQNTPPVATSKYPGDRVK